MTTDPRQHSSVRFTIRLTLHEREQLEGMAAQEGGTVSDIIRNALYDAEVLQLTDAPAVVERSGDRPPCASRLRPWGVRCAKCRGRREKTRRPPSVVARVRARRFLKAKGYHVLNAARALRGFDLVALNAIEVRAIRVTTAHHEADGAAGAPPVLLPAGISQERWVVTAEGAEPSVRLLLPSAQTSE